MLPCFATGLDKNDPAVPIRRGGSRTDALARRLVENPGDTRVYRLRHGIAGWIGENPSIIRTGCRHERNRRA